MRPTCGDRPNAVPATIISSTGPSGAKGNEGEDCGTANADEPAQRPKNDAFVTEDISEGVALARELCRLALEDLCETEGVAAGVAAGVL